MSSNIPPELQADIDDVSPVQVIVTKGSHTILELTGGTAVVAAALRCLADGFDPPKKLHRGGPA